MAQESYQITHEEEFITNSRGKKLMTCRWTPIDTEPKALIFLCHGYAIECSLAMSGSGTTLSKAGYAVYGIDFEGHGQSEGLHGYIPSFDNLVDDCLSFFTSVCEKPEFKKKARFLFGVSMGGAVALLLHRKDPTYWNGAVLVSPMCKIADELKPHPLMIMVLKTMIHIIPTWPIVPTKDLSDVATKVPEKRAEVRGDKYYYRDKPRLKTAYELLVVSTDIEQRLHEVSLPILILHGEDDKVTDPEVSKILYKSAASEDKTLKVYAGMWHTILFGEPQENIDLVYGDIIGWLNARSGHGLPDHQHEKTKHEVLLYNDGKLHHETPVL